MVLSGLRLPRSGLHPDDMTARGGRSSTGRAPALQAGGCRFEPGRLHSFGSLKTRNEATDLPPRDGKRQTVGGKKSSPHAVFSSLFVLTWGKNGKSQVPKAQVDERGRLHVQKVVRGKLAALKTQPVKLRFTLRETALYSFWIDR